MLASPKFIFRVERDPAGVRAGRASIALRDLELASRLSFFLWSSIPDDELLDAGGARAAARRRRRSSGRCGGCWPIRSRRRSSTTSSASGCSCATCRNKQPNSHEFPDFDDNLRRALQTETEMFFASIMREDRSVLDLMTADYTFVNERLARHYGIPDVYGSHFRRVTLTDDARGACSARAPS